VRRSAAPRAIVVTAMHEKVWQSGALELFGPDFQRAGCRTNKTIRRRLDYRFVLCLETPSFHIEFFFYNVLLITQTYGLQSE